MATKPLSVELRNKLAKLIPRLSSPHEGEIVATVSAIERTLASNGCDFHDLTAAVCNEATQTVVDFERGPAMYPAAQLRPIIEMLLDRRARFTNRAVDFLSSLHMRCTEYSQVRLSEKQLTWLEDLMKQAGLQ